FARDRAPADVAPAEAVRPIDAGNGLVDAGLRFAHGLADGRDVEHAPTGREDSAVARFGAGVKNLDAFHFRGFGESLDLAALLVSAGITSGRHHHGERSFGEPAKIEAVEQAVARSHQSR